MEQEELAIIIGRILSGTVALNELIGDIQRAGSVPQARSTARKAARALADISKDASLAANAVRRLVGQGKRASCR